MMKKLLLLFLVLTGMVSTASADGLTIYMKAGEWNNDAPKFAVWAWGEGKTSKYFDFTNLSGDYFYAELEEGYTGGTFIRYSNDQESIGGGTS